MANRRELIEARRKELLNMGYRPGIVQKALDWAEGSAAGMAGYVQKMGVDGSMADEFLPQYLQDCEKWMKSIVGEPTPSDRERHVSGID